MGKLTAHVEKSGCLKRRFAREDVTLPGQKTTARPHHGGPHRGGRIVPRGARLAQAHLASHRPHPVDQVSRVQAYMRQDARRPGGPTRNRDGRRPQLQRARRAHEGAAGEGVHGHRRGRGRRDRA